MASRALPAGTPMDGGSASPAAHATLTEAQRSQVAYRVWYRVDRRALLHSGEPAASADLATLSEASGDEVSGDDEASTGSALSRSSSRRRSERKPRGVAMKHCQRFHEAVFLGGDGIDITKKKYASFKLENKD